MSRWLIILQVALALLTTKTGTWVQTVGTSHYQITIVNQGAPTTPIGFSLTQAFELAAEIEFGGGASQSIRVGDDVFNVTVALIPGIA